MNVLHASSQTTGTRQRAIAKFAHKHLSTTLTKETVSVQLQTHFYSPEGAFLVRIQITGMQFQALALIVLKLISIAPIARSAFAPTTRLTNIMESVLPVIILIIGIKPRECVLSAQKLMSLISSKKNASVLKNCLMILGSNVSAVSGQNTGIKTLKHANNVHPILITLKAS
jgi:hypothetical protein